MEASLRSWRYKVKKKHYKPYFEMEDRKLMIAKAKGDKRIDPSQFLLQVEIWDTEHNQVLDINRIIWFIFLCYVTYASVISVSELGSE